MSRYCVFLWLCLCLPATAFCREAPSRDMVVDRTLDSFDVNNIEAPEVVVTSQGDDSTLYAEPVAFSPESLSEPDEPAKDVKNLQERAWELGTESYMFHYREPGLMHDNAWMWGVYGSYTYRGWLWPGPQGSDDWMLRLEGRYAFGRPDYHGALQDNFGNLTPYKSWGSRDYVYELRAIEGYDLALPFTRLTPFFGFAYRYLQDKPPSGDIYGYKRESNYYYSPLGVETNNRFGSWVLGSRFEYDYFWYGCQYSHLEGGTLKNSQDKGRGARASLRITKETRYLDIVFEPFIRYWHVKRSDNAYIDLGGGWVGIAVEPDNKTLETGARLGIGF